MHGHLGEAPTLPKDTAGCNCSLLPLCPDVFLPLCQQKLELQSPANLWEMPHVLQCCLMSKEEKLGITLASVSGANVILCGFLNRIYHWCLLSLHFYS